MNLQLFFEFLLILFQLFYQFFKVLKAEGCGVRTFLPCPGGQGVDSFRVAWPEDNDKALGQVRRPAHEAHLSLVCTQEAGGGSEFILTIKMDQLLALAAWCPLNSMVI